MLEFVKDIYQSDKPASSKRFFGSIGFICAIVFIGVWKHDLIAELMYVSAGMITADKVINAFTRNKNNVKPK